MPPGQIALTRRDFPVNSIAIARVSPMSPCLAAQYPAEYACPSSPAIEETLTMLPPPFQQVRQCCSGKEERSVQIDRKVMCPFGIRNIRRMTKRVRSRHVDEDVDTTEFVDARLHGRITLSGIRDVRRRETTLSIRADHLDHRLSQLFLVAGDTENLCAPAVENLGDGAPQP